MIALSCFLLNFSQKTLNFYKMSLVEYSCKLRIYTQLDLPLCAFNASHIRYECFCLCINHYSSSQHRIYPASSSLMYPPVPSAARMLLTVFFQEKKSVFLSRLPSVARLLSFNQGSYLKLSNQDRPIQNLYESSFTTVW